MLVFNTESPVSREPLKLLGSPRLRVLYDTAASYPDPLIWLSHQPYKVGVCVMCVTCSVVSNSLRPYGL